METICIVVADDDPTRIAMHFYGNANAWKTILDANRDQLSDPDRVKPGQVRKLPTKPDVPPRAKQEIP
jgi:nucleoid-associated protein YgaU